MNRAPNFETDVWFTKLSEKDLGAFVLGPQGITFIFAPYAVRSFAEGTYEVTVPWGSIADIVLDSPGVDRLITLR